MKKHGYGGGANDRGQYNCNQVKRDKPILKPITSHDPHQGTGQNQKSGKHS